MLDRLRELIARGDPDLEVVVLLRQRNDLAEPLLRMLLAGPAVPALVSRPASNTRPGWCSGAHRYSRASYAAYNVRVGPFAIFVDVAGQVGALAG